ncbi:MAG TPA: translation initiation factor IF-3 [Gammaproteobacteria bacterium]|nr:translation initiation factor IF-3 [Gammaproteobacteria bacterium]
MAVKKRHRIDGDIAAREVRLIDEKGTNHGVVPIDEALQAAQSSGLQLVEIVPNADPPVCRVMDYGKFQFEENKKKQASRKKQKQVQVKEVKFRPGTDVGDFQIKMRNLTRFLNEGNRGKVTIRFRGREMAHRELGAEMLDRIEAELADIAVVEQRPKMEGRQMVMLLAPKKK